MPPHKKALEDFLPGPDLLWQFVEDGFDPLREREIESIFTIGNGYLGTRGSLEDYTSASEPGTYLAGVFNQFSEEGTHCGLVTAPDWTHVEISIDGARLDLETGTLLSQRRVLDVRRGILYRDWRHQDDSGRITRVRSLRFASMADPHLMGQRLMVLPENHGGNITVALGLNARSYPPRQEVFLEIEDKSPIEDGGILLETRTHQTGIRIIMASRSFHGEGNLQKPDVPKHQVSIETNQIAETWSWQAQPGVAQTFSRLATVYTSRDLEFSTHKQPIRPKDQSFLNRHNPEGTHLYQAACAHLSFAAGRGLPAVLMEHSAAWRYRWGQSDIRIDGDDNAQRWTRFALYHLNITGAPWNERVSAGARALSGSVYEGHVFWDTEIFILPFFIYTWPRAARSFLMYRYHTLKVAIQNALESNYRGAYFPWESAVSGVEQTPLYVRLPDGQIIPILSGVMEDHIVSDIAYAVWHYWHASGDQDFIKHYGAFIILECARFWASRVVGPQEDGFYHIEHIVGPDEYHEDVMDNAFTNIMAKWNLIAGIKTAEWLKKNAKTSWVKWLKSSEATYGLIEEEAEQELFDWQHIADHMFDNYHPLQLLFEQHSGFFNLVPVNISEYLDAMMPIDVVLGRKAVQNSQILKQADVLMLFLLLGSKFNPAVWASNYYYYEPRTAHGSSLSPSIHALLAARLGDMGLAMRYFNEAATIDLSDNMGNASGGVHLAGMGGLWQAVIFGFGGIQIIHHSALESPERGTILVDPWLPEAWKCLRFNLMYRDQKLGFTIENLPEESLPEDTERHKAGATKVEVICRGTEAVHLQLGANPPHMLKPWCRYQAIRNIEGQWSEWRFLGCLLSRQPESAIKPMGPDAKASSKTSSVTPKAKVTQRRVHD